jgi:xylulokinase
VSGAASDTFGLREGTPVAIGASDAIAQMIATGTFARSSAFVFSGTSSIVGAAVEDVSARIPGLFNVPTSCAPLPLLYGPTQSGGAALAWVARLLGCDVDDVLALASHSASNFPVFAPYLSGERAPLWDLDVRALFLGVAEEHGRAEIAMAVVAGVFLAARHVLSLIEDTTGQTLNDVEVVGRGVNNAHWEDIARRTLGLTLRFHDDPDMSARGAAMLALALNDTSVLEASRLLAAPSRLVQPRLEDAGIATELLARYRLASEQSVQWRRDAAR